MTTQPDSSSPSSPYDVFLSFRGEDTRTNFTDHLHEALVRKGIRTFIDGELVRGEEISPALVKAIEESRISVIVFSENYASSRWCLDELVKILQCKESKQQIVLPLFYKVDPSDVRKQTNSYGDAFVHHERKFKDDKEKVLKWRRALTEAGNLSGWHFKEGEYETTFINNIVDGILSQVLSHTYWNVAKYPVGIQSHVQNVEWRLDVGGNDRRMVGIWGTSGIGKTTIAKAIWNAIAHKFEGSCFLSNVRDNSMSDGDLIKLQEALLHQILGGEWKIRNVDEGIGVIKKQLSRKKILLILDDVNQLKQLDNLAGVGWFGEGSRVITTTQDSGLLERHGIVSIYKVQMLYDDRALELFSLNAFGKSEPPNDYLELAKRAIAYAQGIPLALTLLGSHLHNIKDKNRWQNILDSYEGEPYTGIQKILRKSYDALEKSVQQVFLDIACFFKGENKDYVLQIVSNSKNKVSRDCIEVLIDKAMITIDYGMIQMHDLLEKLGKDVVHDESPIDPGERSRLWSFEDVNHVLTVKNSGTRKIKGIMLKFSEPREIRLHSKCFVGMINLEIFINRNVFLSGDVKCLPNELRLIDWGGYRCQLQSLPSEFHQVHLANFNMPGGSIKRLGKFKNMLKLTSMDLSGCQFLEEIPDLSGIPNIKYLNLSRCTSLVEVDDSIGRLDKLVQLNLEGCVRLTRFARRLRLKSLENLDLRDCKMLESFPEIEVEMESLWRLCMRGSGIKELPPSIAYLTGLQQLDLSGCFNLTRFGTTLRLKSLQKLDLRDCKMLESFPEIEVEMESLWRLCMRGSGIKELPPSIAYLTGLQQLDLSGCFNLTRFGTTLRLKSLQKLDLSYCKMLESFPEIEVEMKSLRMLNMEESGIRELSPSIAYLTGLRELNLRRCFNLTRFGTTLRLKSLQELDLSYCKMLESFPEIEVKMESLRRLCMRGSGIKELPPSIAYLTGLRELDIRGCFNLTRIATLRLKSLEELDLRNCEGLERFLKLEVEKESLRELYMCGSGIRELPPSITSLTGRRVLDLRGCFNRTRYEATFINNIVDGTLNRVLRRTYWNVAEHSVEIQSHVHDVKKLLDVGGSGRRMVWIYNVFLRSPLPIDSGVEPQLPSDLPPTTTQPVSSSPSSSSFAHGSSWTYDVFLSSRGEDTRTNFTDHLHEALVRKGIRTFIDGELVRGEEISPALVKAIEESRISVIVFSENYASSRWCLDELVKILQCKESKQQIVLPIFYKVDPSDVRKQTNSFGDAFKGLTQSKFKDDKKKVRIWKEALTQAANFSGRIFKDGESEATFINNIVDGILRQVLRHTYWNVAKHPVGIQSRVRDVERHLDVGGNDRRMVGIWGTFGIGKTTIAKAIWNAIAYKFEGSCFLSNVRENSMSDGDLIELQEALLHKILGKEWKIHSVDEGIGVIKEQLRRKKILLILDDVDRLEQLDKLAGDDWFGEGSRVIITTKNRRLLDNRQIELIYEVKKLDYNQALELFSWHAFRRSEPPEDYLELAQRAIAFADGLPLPLTILGSYLRGVDIQHWQVILDDYEGEPYTHIERILQKSYDDLDDRAKQYFLDIACFFKGEYKNYVQQIVPQEFIEQFVDEALITIECNKILMHNLLANLGKDIVRKESPNDPGQRSRLWFYEDVERVLTESTGTRNIKAIMVKLPEPAEITLNPECFRKMVNLQIFINHNASLCGDINYLPNALRFIDWPSCQLQSLPSEFHPVRLAVFNMPHNHIKQLEGFKNLTNLTSMNLRGCQFLEKIPNLSRIPNIKYLILSDCSRLVEIDDSVGLLDKLVVLYLDECIKLRRFGTRLRLKSLETLTLWGCIRLESFPEIEVEMEALRELYMQRSGIRELPLSIAYLTELRHLDLAGCFNLTRFPTLRLKSLEVLDLKDCKRLESFPELELLSTNSNISFPLPNPLSCWSTLRELNLSGTNFVKLPECISKFVSLEMLYLRDCESLLEIPQEVLPPRVGRVFLDNCTSLEKFPKLPLSLEVEDKELSLINCVRLRGYDITENIFLDQVSSPHSQFQITLPGDEVPKWFSCCKDVTLVERSFGCNGRCEVCFEIPPNLDWETLRLVLCVVNKGNACVHLGGAETRVHINRKLVQSTFVKATETHVSLNCIPLLNRSELGMGEELTRLQQGNKCQIIFEFYDMPTPVKILCGVHLLGHQVADVTVDDDIHDDQHQDNELLSFPSASETSLGKRPRLSDVGDHETQRGEADHPKRRHTDLNEEPKQ